MIVFKPFPGRDCDNNPIAITDASVNRCGNLLSKIAQMPRKQPVSLQQAWFLMQDDFFYEFFELQDFDSATKILEKHWVDRVSDLGYHIVLNGSEYEEGAIA